MGFKRELKAPKQSFFLFGPRGTGKSTWLQEVFRPNLRIDLLRSQEFLALSRDPGKHDLKRDEINVFSVRSFCKRLHDGEFLA